MIVGLGVGLICGAFVLLLYGSIKFGIWLCNVLEPREQNDRPRILRADQCPKCGRYPIANVCYVCEWSRDSNATT